MNPRAMLNTVHQLKREQSGFRALGRQLLVMVVLLSAILLQRDIAAAAATESLLRRAVDSVSSESPKKLDDVLDWCLRAYEGWYAYDEGLNAADRTARERAMGVTPGYAPTLSDAAPLLLPSCAVPGSQGPLSHEPSAQAEPPPEGEPPPEPGAPLPASHPASSSGPASEPASEPPPEPVADPEPQLSDDGGTGEGADGVFPDSCRRVAIYEEERRARKSCASGGGGGGGASAGAVASAGDTVPRASLLGTPNRFLGAMLIVQTRLESEPCGDAVTDGSSAQCYSRSGAPSEAPLPPYSQFWHFYHARAKGYLLPVDLGRWGIPKDSGRCAIHLARAHNWTGPATASVVVHVATYNAQLRRLGSIAVRFGVDGAGGITMTSEVRSSMLASAPYRRFPRAIQPYCEALGLLLLLVLDVRPLYRKSRALGFGRALLSAPRLDIWLGWIHFLAVIIIFGAQVLRAVDSALHFDAIAAGPARDIRDHPQDFERVLSSVEWMASDGTRERRHSYLLLLILGVGAARLLLSTRFHPRMSVMIDTLAHAFSSLQSLLVLYFSCLVLFAVGGHSLFGPSVPYFATLGSALYTVFVASVGEFEKARRFALSLSRARTLAHSSPPSAPPRPAHLRL